MIIFDLSCGNGHRFEGWFRSAEDFDDQCRRGLVSCAECGSAAVGRLPSAPHLAGAKAPAPARQTEGAAPTGAPPHPLAAIKRFVELMVSRSEDVGPRFAEEARRIHYEEAPVRPIRGQASERECESLRDEGIDVLRLPVVGSEDLN